VKYYLYVVDLYGVAPAIRCLPLSYSPMMFGEERQKNFFTQILIRYTKAWLKIAFRLNKQKMHRE